MRVLLLCPGVEGFKSYGSGRRGTRKKSTVTGRHETYKNLMEEKNYEV